MRFLPVMFASVLIGLLGEAHAQDADAAFRAYVAQADDIAAKLLFAEFAKHPDRVHHLVFTFSVFVDAQGRPHDVKITKTHDKFVEDTARRTLIAAKFPPIPKKLAQGHGELRLRIEGDIDAEVSR
jgi:hypothetical protein